MCAYLLNESVQYKLNCTFSAKKQPLPPGRCRKDFFYFYMYKKFISKSTVFRYFKGCTIANEGMQIETFSLRNS